MYRISTILFVAAFFFEKGFTKIPDFIHPCKLSDRMCLLKSTQDAIPEFSKGLPEFGVPPMDPFYIEKLSVSLPGVKISFYKSKVTGLRKVAVDDIYYKNNKLTLVLRGNMTLKGQYEFQGNIFALPINAKGDAKIKMYNLKGTFVLNTTVIADDEGVEHFTTKNYKLSYDYGDKATYNFTNLFPENPELSNTVLTFVNANWRVIAEEFGKPVLDYALDLVMNTVDKFFLAVPYVELIDRSIS